MSTRSTGSISHDNKWTSPLYERLLLFAGAAALLFLLGSRYVNIFDEGILLTGTMRTMAGQVLHRDFNYNYGPAELYLLAGLFKVFGASVFVERLAGALSSSGLVVTVYILVQKFCGRVLASGAALVCILWLVGLDLSLSLAISSMSMLTLWTCWLIVPVTQERLQRRRSVGAGFLAAIMFLFRYDLGLGTVAANLVAIVIMTWLRGPGAERSLSRMLKATGIPYLAAFVVTVTPAAIAYLSVAPIHDLLYDVVIYMAKYFRLGRGLPFPRFELTVPLAAIGYYSLPIIVIFGLGVAAQWLITRRRAAPNAAASPVPEWINLTVSLSVAAAMICAKGLVRTGVGAVYGSLFACVVLAAIALRHRDVLNVWFRGALTAIVALFVLAAASFAQPRLSDHWHLRPLVINWILTPNRQPPTAAFRGWCHEGTPITRGLCFLLDEDHIQTVRYLEAHTRPGDYLYVGLPRHDRIFANDMTTYFAVQRLPAVKWTEFDPFLENLADIQQEMIGELERNRPPYVVLDAEFENYREPNGSSVSTGVHLLDDYIAEHYVPEKTFGEMTILKRR